MENLDIYKILGYGISGFAIILSILAYNLLKSEQNRKGQVRPEMLKSIRQFLFSNIGLVVIVGGLSLPVFNKNKELKQTNENLEIGKSSSDSLLLVMIKNKLEQLESQNHNIESEVPKEIVSEVKEDQKDIVHAKEELASLKTEGIDKLSISKILRTVDTLEQKNKSYELKLNKIARPFYSH